MDPVGPAGPVDQVGPVGPVDQVGPVDLVGLVDQVGPVDPAPERRQVRCEVRAVLTLRLRCGAECERTLPVPRPTRS